MPGITSYLGDTHIYNISDIHVVSGAGITGSIFCGAEGKLFFVGFYHVEFDVAIIVVFFACQDPDILV